MMFRLQLIKCVNFEVNALFYNRSRRLSNVAAAITQTTGGHSIRRGTAIPLITPSHCRRFQPCLRGYSETNTSFTIQDPSTYESIAEETLQQLSERLEEAVEHVSDSDVSYDNGVMKVSLGAKWGTYVINKQTPNRQIWLSSPSSGPKRYDFVDGHWVYRRDGSSLHQLLSNEISGIVGKDVDLTSCAYGRSNIS